MNPDEFLMTLREVMAATGLGRSTIYEREAGRQIPSEDASLPKARARWRRADIESYLAAQSKPEEDAAEIEHRKIRFADAPRRGGRRRYDQNRLVTDRIVDPYHASPLDAEHEAALRKKLGLDEGQDYRETVKPIRWRL